MIVAISFYTILYGLAMFFTGKHEQLCASEVKE
nr:MAG TPA: hypothetical protein [Caudoviricetes sp.]